MLANLPEHSTADLSIPVLRRVMGRQELVDMLLGAVGSRYPLETRHEGNNRIRFNDFSRIVGAFGAFLQSGGQETLNPDESTIGRFAEHLHATGFATSRRSAEQDASRVRILINSFSADLLQRPLLTPQEVSRQKRYDHLTPASKEALLKFLSHGRKLKANSTFGKPVLSARLYSPRNRENTVDKVIRFLREVGTNDLLAITARDAESYVARQNGSQRHKLAMDLLVDIRPLFGNLVALGLMAENPVADYSEKETRLNDDYVPAEGIALLQDMSTVDWQDWVDVAGRLATFGLAYDFALRNGEISRLRVSDVKIADYVEMSLRPEIQKGEGKPAATLLSYFPQTKRLMVAYLKLRAKVCLDTDALLVNRQGGRLLDNGCRDLIQDHCRRLGVKTHKGLLPSPHRFRHSLGTLNAEPLGLKLSVHDIMRRLRHTSYDVTTRTYITNNPLIERARHEARFNPMNTMNTMNTPNSQRPVAMLAPQEEPEWILEAEALSRLRGLGIRRSALQAYFKKQGLVRKTPRGFVYVKQGVDALTTRHVSKEEAMRMLGLSRSGLAYWASSNGIESVLIGKVSLWSLDEIMDGMRRKTA